MKRIVLTGGGTAGHVSPNQALIPHLLDEGWDIHYIGTKKGIERSLIEPMQGVTYHAVSSGKLRRYFDWQNFTDPFRVIAGAFQSIGIIGKLKPDVVFSKGGFVSVPVVFGAAICGVPVVMHESDITPGLANKLSKPFAKSICTTFPECAKLYRLIGAERLGDVFAYVSDAGKYLRELPQEQAADIVEAMDADDAVDALETVSPELRSALM